VEAVHAMLPHLQGEEVLKADPSVDVHEAMGAALQTLPAAKQYLPLKELHAAVPHAQSSPVLSEAPPTLVQGSPLEQVLVEEVQ